jgi:hypothetical protein
MAVPTLLQTDGGAAMFRRSTSGCGIFGAARPAWETTERKDAVSEALHKRAAETVLHRKAAPSMYEYV